MSDPHDFGDLDILAASDLNRFKALTLNYSELHDLSVLHGLHEIDGRVMTRHIVMGDLLKSCIKPVDRVACRVIRNDGISELPCEEVILDYPDLLQDLLLGRVQLFVILLIFSGEYATDRLEYFGIAVCECHSCDPFLGRVVNQTQFITTSS